MMNDPYEEAIRALNNAAYAVIRACSDTVQYPMVDRQSLREIARATDKLVDEYEPAELIRRAGQP